MCSSMQAAKAAQAQNGMARRLGSTEAILSISTESRAYHSTSAQARVGIAGEGRKRLLSNHRLAWPQHVY